MNQEKAISITGSYGQGLISAVESAVERGPVPLMHGALPILKWTRQSVAAKLLILSGLAGMALHFSSPPESETSPPGSWVTPVTAPVTQRFPVSATTGQPSETAQNMRRRLREFVVPWPGIKALPLSDALAVLQHHWQTLPHETDAVPPASFLLSQAASERISASKLPVLVSLEIPGIPMLTQLQLLAAQSELHLRITETGAFLDLPSPKPAAGNPVALFRLNHLMLDHFSSRSLVILDGEIERTGMDARQENFLSKSLPDWIGGDIQKRSGAESRYIAVIEADGGNAKAADEAKASGSQETEILPDSASQVSITDSKVLTDPPTTLLTLIPIEGLRQMLSELFAGMGIFGHQPPTNFSDGSSTDKYLWSLNTGRMMVRGSPRTHRVAAVTIAAMQESANAAARLEFATAAWEKGQAPPEPTAIFRNVNPQSTANHGTQKVSPSTLFRFRHNTACGVPVVVPLPPLWSNPDQLLPPPDLMARVLVEESGSRLLLDFSVEAPGDPGILVTNAGQQSPAVPSLVRQLVKANHWCRFDIIRPADGSNDGRVSVFVRVNRAPATPE